LGKLKSFLKTFVYELGIELVGLEAVRGYLLERLRKVTPNDLYKAIKEETSVWEVASEGDKHRGRIWARKFKSVKDRLTPKLVLEWLSKDRPDLAMVIKLSDGGRNWLKKEVETIKEHLWGD